MKGLQAMVDSIGNKAGVFATRRVAPVAPASAMTAATAVNTETQAVQSTAATLSSGMAAEAPVDAERVARIRKAIQEGRFPIYPSTIADRLLALKLEWNPNG
jgi:negative regulator of flagellin synthesis FlgM